MFGAEALFRVNKQNSEGFHLYMQNKMTVVSTEESTEIRQVSLDMIIMSRVSGCQSFYIRDGSTSCCNQIVTLEHNHAALDHQNLPSENFISEVVQSHVRSES